MRREENWGSWRKSSQCIVDNQQTQSTYDAESGNRTQATLVGGKCFHHSAIPTPPRKIMVAKGNWGKLIVQFIVNEWNKFLRGRVNGNFMMQINVFCFTWECFSMQSYSIYSSVMGTIISFFLLNSDGEARSAPILLLK